VGEDWLGSAPGQTDHTEASFLLPPPPSFLLLEASALCTHGQIFTKGGRDSAYQDTPWIIASSFFFFFVVLGFELRAYTLSHSTSPFFVTGFFEIRFYELFAQAGFKS
jgi:hypothetical protein